MDPLVKTYKILDSGRIVESEAGRFVLREDYERLETLYNEQQLELAKLKRKLLFGQKRTTPPGGWCGTPRPKV